MRIKWHNLLAVVLVIAAVVLFINNREAVVSFVVSTRSLLNPRDHTAEEIVGGLIAFTLILACILAIVRLSSSGRAGTGGEG